MEEKKYQFLGKPLKMTQLFRGFAPSLIDPLQITEFKWTESIYDLSHGQVAWARPRIDAWLAEINKESDVQIKNHSFKKDKTEHNRFGKNTWYLKLELIIPGALKHQMIDSSLSKEFSGFVKKFLGTELMRRFPLELKPDIGQVFFKAGIPDLYVLSPPDRSPDRYAQMQEKLLSADMYAKLKEKLKDRFNVELCFLKYMGEDLRFFRNNVLMVKWLEDATADQRFKLLIGIDDLLKEGGFVFTKDNWQCAMYTAISAT